MGDYRGHTPIGGPQVTPHLSSPPSIAAPRWPKRCSISWRAARAACSPCTGSTAHGSVGIGGLGGAQRGLGGSCRPALGVVGAVMGGWSGGGHPGGGVSLRCLEDCWRVVSVLGCFNMVLGGAELLGCHRLVLDVWGGLGVSGVGRGSVTSLRFRVRAKGWREQGGHPGGV